MSPCQHQSLLFSGHAIVKEGVEAEYKAYWVVPPVLNSVLLMFLVHKRDIPPGLVLAAKNSKVQWWYN